MNLFHKKGLRYRFNFSLILIIVFILFIFSTIVIIKNFRTVEAGLEKELEDISRLSKISLPNALWQFNHDYVSDFINAILIKDDVVFVEVVTKRNNYKRASHDFDSKVKATIILKTHPNS